MDRQASDPIPHCGIISMVTDAGFAREKRGENFQLSRDPVTDLNLRGLSHRAPGRLEEACGRNNGETKSNPMGRKPQLNIAFGRPSGWGSAAQPPDASCLNTPIAALVRREPAGVMVPALVSDFIQNNHRSKTG